MIRRLATVLASASLTAASMATFAAPVAHAAIGCGLPTSPSIGTDIVGTPLNGREGICFADGTQVIEIFVFGATTTPLGPGFFLGQSVGLWTSTTGYVDTAGFHIAWTGPTLLGLNTYQLQICADNTNPNTCENVNFVGP